MQKVNNYCRSCESFTQYYESGLTNFWAVACGFCNINEEIVQNKSTCSLYCKKALVPLTVEEVDCAVNNVKEIKKLLKILEVF